MLAGLSVRDSTSSTRALSRSGSKGTAVPAQSLSLSTRKSVTAARSDQSSVPSSPK